MVRRLSYAIAGWFVSLGAPLGLLATRLRRQRLSLADASSELTRHPDVYAYVSITSSIALSAFGYVVGRQADRLAELSETDPLTALGNARALSERLETELARARRYREAVTIALIDLDRLKRINDAQGHSAGDAALRLVADAIRTGLREPDFAARWGGDEFAIVAPKTPHDAALVLAERIRALIAELGASRRLTASIGIVSLGHDGDHAGIDRSMVMEAADAALYDAKRHGGNAVAIRVLHAEATPSASGAGR